MIKNKHFFITLQIVFTIFWGGFAMAQMPEDFVFLTDVAPTIIESVRYYGGENFLGRPVTGYEVNRIICTKVAAEKLKLVQEKVQKQGYNLVAYDGYRPVRAVNDFVKWGEDINDIAAKKYYYPTVEKKDMFELGYVAKKSSHSRGSTFDVTLIKANQSLKPVKKTTVKLLSGEEIPFLDDNTVNMGTSFDLFHESSHPYSKLVDENAHKMRKILLDSMKEQGFIVSQVEWWHYTLEHEPYGDTYFDFVVN
jgi:D-alanyl-D-alanine dipeptidase